MQNKKGCLSKSATFSLLLVAALSLALIFSALPAAASPSSSFYYRFTVDKEGATTILINFQSSDSSGSSWVIVPKDWTSSPTVLSGAITQSSLVDTKEVVGESQYFYLAYRFTYRASTTTRIFNMTVQFSTNTGALIVEPEGIFFSPLIGFDYPTSSGRAETVFDSSLTVNSFNAVAIGTTTYQPTQVGLHRAVFNLYEKLLRLQIELSSSLSAQYTTIQSANGVFTFTAVKRYATYASGILGLYDRIYDDYTQLFNVTLTPPIGVQFFLPSFDEFLTLGGFTPFTDRGAGKININVFFIRAVNGTIEVIAAHELVHHFLIKAGLSPNDFLWFHEGMAQYVSVTVVEKLGYEGATIEKNDLEDSAAAVIQRRGENNLGFVQNWSPSFSPSNVGEYYAASYYVVSRLGQDYGGLDYYQRAFKLIHGVGADNIDVLTLYLSQAANASVALTLQIWGFNVADLYTSADIRDKIVEAQTAIAAVSPLFQPYRSLAEFFYQQALLDFRRGNLAGGSSLLQLAITIAQLAPLLTFLTVAAILGIIAYLLYRRSVRRAKLRRAALQASTLPPPPPDVAPQSPQ